MVTQAHLDHYRRSSGPGLVIVEAASFCPRAESAGVNWVFTAIGTQTDLPGWLALFIPEEQRQGSRSITLGRGPSKTQEGRSMSTMLLSSFA